MPSKNPPSNTVEFVDADGNTRWSASDAPAYLSRPTEAAPSRPTRSAPGDETPNPD